MKRRRKPQLVPRGRVTERIIEGTFDILREIPVLTHREKDAGPYLTCAVTMARDP